MNMKKNAIIFFLLIAATSVFSQNTKAYVTGKVTDASQQLLRNVNVIVKAANRGTFTDANGEYTIVANPGDTLVLSYLGMQTIEVLVERSPSVINVEMEATGIDLESLEIKAKRKLKTQGDLLAEYPENKNLIKTTWGILDKDRSSVRLRIIDGKDLIPVGTDFLYSLQNHYPLMQVDRANGKVYFQKISYSSDAPVIFDVDGVIYESIPIHLYVNEIERVAILERNAAAFKYGPQGAGGVIVINTKAQTWIDDPGIKQQYDNRTLIDSLRTEASRIPRYLPYTFSPLSKIQESRTEEQALAMYAQEKERYRENPYYFLEVYDYIASQWGSKEQSDELFRYIIDSFKHDLSVLKALAYLQQQYGQHERALPLYAKILKEHHGQAQAHRDMANAYAELGNVERAMSIYTKYANDICQLPHPPFDAFGEDLLMTTEMMTLLENNKRFFSDNYNIRSTTDSNDTLTRVVFEWNNPKAIFEIQLMSPAGNYETWSNKKVQAMAPNPEEIQAYYSKQFFLNQDNKGSWQVNIDYQGNRSKAPTYLKVSIYENYGLANQNTKIEVYKLSEVHKKVQLLVLQQS